MGGLSDERTRLEGRLRLLQEEVRKLRMRADNYRKQARLILDPIAPVEDLELNNLVSEIVPELFAIQGRIKSRQRDIQDIQDLIR